MGVIAGKNNSNKRHKYTKEELLQLHNELYDILAQIINVCEKHKIPYFVIGGTVIGAMYDHAILPWDDDLDIGMTRENYDRFLKVAQDELGAEYFLSIFETDSHTPFFYAKVKKNNTLYVEEKFQRIDMHHGIFVDIFPFDNVSDNKMLRKIQYKIVNFLKTCFMGAEVWMWKYFRKCEIEEPLKRSMISTFMCWCIVSLFSKETIYKMMNNVMTLWNKQETSFVGLVITQVDYFKKNSLIELQKLKFGPLSVTASSDLEYYMRYNSLHRFTDEELFNHKSHQPVILKFSK